METIKGNLKPIFNNFDKYNKSNPSSTTFLLKRNTKFYIRFNSKTLYFLDLIESQIA